MVGELAYLTSTWLLPGDLKRFWEQMGQRAQPSELDGERDAKRGRGLGRRAR
jgi:hypothetical protein